MPDGANDHSTIEEGGRAGRRGHIGLIVLSSVAAGLVLGLVLDVLVFGGSRETMITGFALLSLAVGCAMLAELSARCTDQPQRWARIAALCFGVTGAAILILRPSGHVLGLLGWVWPILLVALVVWMFQESRRSLHSWSRRAVLYPAFVVLTLVALGGAIETVVEATKSNQPPSGGRTYLVAGHKSLPALCGLRVASCDLVQWAWGADAELGLGAKRYRGPHSGLCLRSRGGGVEQNGRRRTGRTSTLH